MDLPDFSLEELLELLLGSFGDVDIALLLKLGVNAILFEASYLVVPEALDEIFLNTACGSDRVIDHLVLEEVPDNVPAPSRDDGGAETEVDYGPPLLERGKVILLEVLGVLDLPRDHVVDDLNGFTHAAALDA